MLRATQTARSERRPPRTCARSGVWTSPYQTSPPPLADAAAPCRWRPSPASPSRDDTRCVGCTNACPLPTCTRTPAATFNLPALRCWWPELLSPTWVGSDSNQAPLGLPVRSAFACDAVHSRAGFPRPSRLPLSAADGPCWPSTSLSPHMEVCWRERVLHLRYRRRPCGVGR
jgi:hypothetical protein